MADKVQDAAVLAVAERYAKMNIEEVKAAFAAGNTLEEKLPDGRTAVVTKTEEKDGSVKLSVAAEAAPAAAVPRESYVALALRVLEAVGSVVDPRSGRVTVECRPDGFSVSFAGI